MVGEHQRRARLQRRCHAAKHLTEPDGELREPSLERVVTGQFKMRPRRGRRECDDLLSQERSSQTKQKSISSAYWTLSKYGGSVKTASSEAGARSRSCDGPQANQALRGDPSGSRSTSLASTVSPGMGMRILRCRA